MLVDCSPGALAPTGNPVRVTKSSRLGDCRVREPRTMMGGEDPPAGLPSLRRLSSLGAILGVVACRSGTAPVVDFATHEYWLFREFIPSSDSSHIVFAIDDGQQVHVALRTSSACKGLTPGGSLTTELFSIERRDRPLLIHRCAPAPSRCGNKPLP